MKCYFYKPKELAQKKLYNSECSKLLIKTYFKTVDI